jgi:hypothetical protein
MLRLGVSLPALMQLLGHKDIRMTLRYVQVTQQDLQREFRLARQNAVHLHHIPQLPLPQTTVPLRADPSTIRDAISATRHLLEMFRLQLEDHNAVVNFDGLPNGSSTSAANSITSRKNERTLAGQWT